MAYSVVIMHKENALNEYMQNREEKPTLHLDNRSKLYLTGVLNIHNFDDEVVTLTTKDGMLTVEGEDLHISTLSIEHGKVEIEGRVNGLYFSDGKPKVKQGLFGRFGKGV